MCFDTDGSWYAEVSEYRDGPTTRVRKCCDCGTVIIPPEECLVIHQQEHELCQICEDDESVDFIEKPPPHKHDYGETFDGVVCSGCLKCRKAVREYETKEGCPAHAREPVFGLLAEVFQEHEQQWEYAEACVAAFPELIEHTLIKSMLID